MTTLREAAKMALEALVLWEDEAPHAWSQADENAVAALRAALAGPEQEPVAWLYRDAWGTMKLSQTLPPPVGAFPVYTAPTPRQWVGLTDAELAEFSDAKLGSYDLCLEVEAKLKEKNT